MFGEQTLDGRAVDVDVVGVVVRLGHGRVRVRGLTRVALLHLDAVQVDDVRLEQLAVGEEVSGRDLLEQRLVVVCLRDVILLPLADVTRFHFFSVGRRLLLLDSSSQ